MLLYITNLNLEQIICSNLRNQLTINNQYQLLYNILKFSIYSY